MVSKVGIPVAVVGAVVSVVVVLGGIFVFADDESEPGGGPAAGPAPTTLLSLPEPGPSGRVPPPAPGDPYPPVPSGQVDGDLFPSARTAGRNVYIPVLESVCTRDQVWPRGEYADRVEVEIRELPVSRPPRFTTDAEGNRSHVIYTACVGSGGQDDPYAVIELAEPLGDRRLVVTRVIGSRPSR